MGMNGGRVTYGIDFQVDKSGLQNALKELEKIKNMSYESFQAKNSQIIDTAAMKQQFTQVRRDAEELEKAIRSSFNSTLNSWNTKKLQGELNKLDFSKIQKSFSTLGADGAKAFRDIGIEALTASNKIQKTQGILDKISHTMVNTIKWGITSRVMNEMAGSVQQAYGYVKSLDTSLNNIRIVTGKSADEMDRFAKQANRAAQELGKSTTDYTNASLIYYQQGLGDQDVKARTETTLKTASVTQQDAKEVSEELTAVWNGFQVNSLEAEAAVDKLAAVAANSASNLEELATGMSKVSAAAHSLGASEDQVAAQIATIISVTRDAPETVGTALKTIYARMSDLKVDGVDEFGTKLGDVSGKLKQMGIDIYDQTGELRGMGDVIEEVGEKWGDWSDAQQRAAAQALAGKRQYTNLIALFDNWDKYTKNLNISMQSQGTLEEQNSIHMESLQAKTEKYHASLENLRDSLLDSDSFKGLLEGLTTATNGFATFIDSIGGGGNALLGLGAIATKVFKNQIAKELVNLKQNFTSVKKSAEDTASSLAISSQLKAKGIEDEIVRKTAQTVNNAARAGASHEDIEEVKKVAEAWNELKTQQEAADAELKEAEDEFRNLAEIAGATGQEIEDALKEMEEQGEATGETVSKIIEKYKKLKSSTQKTDAKEYFKETGGVDFNGKFAPKSDTMKNAVKNMIAELNRLGPVGKKVAKEIESSFDKLSKASKEDFDQASEEFEKTWTESIGEVIAEFDRLDGAMGEDSAKNLQQTKQKAEELADSVRQGGEAMDSLNQKFTDVNKAQQFVDTLSNIQSVCFAIKQIGSISDILQDDDLSPWEKFLEILMSLSSAISMVMMTTGNLGNVFSKLGGSLSSIGSAAGTAATATSAVGAAAEGAAASEAAMGAAGAAAGGEVAAGAAAAGTGITAMLGPIGLAIAGIVAVITIIETLTSWFGKGTEKAREELEKAEQEADSAQSELESLQGELKTTADRIDELNKKDHLTFVEKAELEKLQQANRELEHNIKLNEQKAKDARVKKSQKEEELLDSRNIDEVDLSKKDTIEKANKETTYDKMDDSHLSPVEAAFGEHVKLSEGNGTDLGVVLSFLNSLDTEDIDDDYQKVLDTFRLAQMAQRKEGWMGKSTTDKSKAGDGTNAGTEDARQAIVDALPEKMTVLNKTAAEVSKAVTTMEQLKADGSAEFENRGGEAELQRLRGLSDQFNELINDGLAKTEKFNSIVQNLDPEELSNLTGQVWGGLSEEELKKNFPDIAARLQEYGMTYAEFVEQIKSTTDEVGSDVAIASLEALTKATTEWYASLEEAKNKALNRDKLDKETYEGLVGEDESLKQYFEMMADGTYKMTGNAEKFKEAVDAIEADKLNQTTTYAEDQADIVNSTDSFTAFSDANNITQENDYDHVQSQINYAQQFGGEGVAEQVSQWQEELNKAKAAGEALNDTLKNGVAKTVQDIGGKPFEQLKENEEEIKEKAKEMGDALWNARHPLDEDIDEKAWYETTDAIQELSKASNEFSKHLTKNRRAAGQVASEIMRFGAACKSTKENYKQWVKDLKSGNKDLVAQQKAIKQVKNALGDMLGRDTKLLPNSFAKSAKNLKLMQQAANGSKKAMAKLEKEARKVTKHELKKKVKIDLDDKEKEKFYKTLDQMDKHCQNAIKDIKVGAEIKGDDLKNLQNDLNEIVKATGMTAAEAEEYLASMGVDAEVVEDTHTQKDTSTYQDVISDVQTKTTQVSAMQPDGNPADVPLTTANIITRRQPSKVTEEKTTTATGLKIKTAHKAAGGNVKINHNSSSTSSGGGGGGGGGGSKSKPTTAKGQKIKAVNKTRSPYRDLDTHLTSYNHQLEMNQKLEKFLSGDELNDKLSERVKIYEKLIKENQQYVKVQEDELKKKQQKLKKGVFADDVETMDEIFGAGKWREKKKKVYYKKAKKNVSKKKMQALKKKKLQAKKKMDQAKKKYGVNSSQYKKAKKSYDKASKNYGLVTPKKVSVATGKVSSIAKKLAASQNKKRLKEYKKKHGSAKGFKKTTYKTTSKNKKDLQKLVAQLKKKYTGSKFEIKSKGKGKNKKFYIKTSKKKGVYGKDKVIQKAKSFKYKLTKKDFNKDGSIKDGTYDKILNKYENAYNKARKAFNKKYGKDKKFKDPKKQKKWEKAQAKAQKKVEALLKQRDKVKDMLDGYQEEWEAHLQKIEELQELEWSKLETIIDRYGKKAEEIFKNTETAMKANNFELDLLQRGYEKLQKIQGKEVGVHQLASISAQRANLESQNKENENNLALQRKANMDFREAYGSTNGKVDFSWYEYDDNGKKKKHNGQFDGFQFDKDGKITQESLDAIANSKLPQVAKDKLLEIAEQYKEGLIKELDIEDLISDNQDKIAQAYADEFLIPIETAFDVQKSEEDWFDFEQNVLSRWQKDAQDKLTFTPRIKNPTARNLADQMGGLSKLVTNITSSSDLFTGGLHSVFGEWQKSVTSNDGKFGDNHKLATETLENMIAKSKEQLQNLVNAMDQAYDTYLNAINAADQAVGDMLGNFDQLIKAQNHQIKKLEIIEGKFSKNIGKHYDAMAKASEDKSKLAQSAADNAKAQMDKLARAGKKDSEEWKLYYQQWLKYQDQANTELENSINYITQKITADIAATFDDLNKVIINGREIAVGQVDEEWQLRQKNATRYLDTMNKAYDIQSLRNKYDTAISDLKGNEKAQKKLNDLKESELKMLREAGELRQYDVDRANKMYDIALKQIALEEAQKNKSKMRLQRDSQGNYTYRYVADQDKINKAQEELNKANQDLYNFDYKQMVSDTGDLNKKRSDASNYRQKMETDYANGTIDKKEYERRLEIYQKEYVEPIEKAAADLEKVQQNLQQSTFLGYKVLLDQNADVDIPEANKKVIESVGSTFDFILEKGTGALSQISDEMKRQTMEDVPAYGESVDIVNGEFKLLGEKGQETLQKLHTEVDTAKTDQVELAKNISDTTEEIEEQTEGYEKLVEQQQESVDAAYTQYESMVQLAEGYALATEELEKYLAALNEYKLNQNEAGEVVTEDPTLNSMGNSSDKTFASEYSAIRKKIGYDLDGKSGGKQTDEYHHKISYNDAIDLLNLADLEGMDVSSIKKKMKKNKYGNLTDPALEEFRKWLKKNATALGIDNFEKFATGGYTGEWGTDGKIAMLHEKELVLNQEDTARILDAVNIVRSIADRLGDVSYATREPGAIQSSGTEKSETNYVTINADFPGVSQARQIELAFENLKARASQVASYK